MSVFNTTFTTTIYKNKFQVLSFKCHVFVTKGFSTDIYATYAQKMLISRLIVRYIHRMMA